VLDEATSEKRELASMKVEPLAMRTAEAATAADAGGLAEKKTACDRNAIMARDPNTARDRQQWARTPTLSLVRGPTLGSTRSYGYLGIWRLGGVCRAV